MSGSVISRILIALVATSTLAAALYWGFLRNDRTDPSAGTTVELDFSRLEDGAPPTHFDTGQPAWTSRNNADPGSNFVIRNGKLTYAPATDGVALATLSTPDLGAPVSTIGARWVFEPRGGGAGAVGLYVSTKVQSYLPTVVPPIPIHFVATPVNWNLSVKKDDAVDLEVIAAGEFSEPLKVDSATAYEAELTISGSRVEIRLPDGGERRVDDARISQWRGNFATFSVWSNHGLVDCVAGFEKIWASSQAVEQ